MKRKCFLWIDLKACPDHSLLDSIHAANLARIVTGEVPQAIDNFSPSFLCFDFDSPDGAGLSLLGDTKKKYPGLPILMLTEAHSEKLAVWAYRNRVWDYLVKPFPIGELEKRMDLLLEMGMDSFPRQNRFPQDWTALDGAASEKRRATRPAVSYIEANFTKKISLGMLAKLCNMSPYHFCRLFKEENGMSFVEFVTKKRIDKARLILPASSVKETAFAVGFDDPSYFSRVFRRHVGTSPRHYRSM